MKPLTTQYVAYSTRANSHNTRIIVLSISAIIAVVTSIVAICVYVFIKSAPIGTEPLTQDRSARENGVLIKRSPQSQQHLSALKSVKMHNINRVLHRNQPKASEQYNAIDDQIRAWRQEFKETL